ncbi:MAG: efflux RND transporter periplasmic adaptor subunit [Alphaproteobacteria bacterium]|nr:efflux RND transporter periplasmic adaptor subunit [Alphaproteobacteria bacterium]
MPVRNVVVLTLVTSGLIALAILYVVVWKRLDVVVAPVKRGPAVQAVYATGVVEPVNWAKVTPLVQGRIAELCKCEGESVNLNTVLARLDDREARARLAELNARETFLASEAERYRKLLGRRTVSVQAYEQAVSELLQARAAVQAQKERLDHFILRAPMNGEVLRRDGEIGEIVGPGDALFWVGKTRPLWVVAEVDEEDIPMVAADQSVLIKADAFPARDLPGTVRRITPKGDPVSKSYRVRVALPDDTPLMIGMTTEVNIIADRKENVLLVPVTAVLDGHVFVAEDGKARARPVEVGVVGSAFTEILRGVAEGEMVVVDPPHDLADGAAVDVETGT